MLFLNSLTSLENYIVRISIELKYNVPSYSFVYTVPKLGLQLTTISLSINLFIIFSMNRIVIGSENGAKCRSVFSKVRLSNSY